MALTQISADNYIVTHEQQAFHFSMGRPDDIIDEGFTIWPTGINDVQPIMVAGTEYKVIPLGRDNLLPKKIKDVIQDAHLPGGIFKKMLFLNWGQGPHLYKMDFESGVPVRQYVEDATIQAWLESWDYTTYLKACVVDFNHGEGCYTKFLTNRGVRIGRPGKFTKLEHIPWGDARLEWPEDFKNSKAIIVANWEFPQLVPVYRYNKIDINQPFKHEVSAHFAYLPSFLSRFYSIPSFAGALPWMKNSSLLPRAIKALMSNAAIVKFHIKIPKQYWDDIESRLKTECQQKNIPYTEKILQRKKSEVMQELAKVLSGYDNAGKFFQSTSSKDNFGNVVGWEIEPIDQKIKDYIDSMKTVNAMADRATIGGIGLHQALANVSAEGKSDSGSEQLYALKLYKDSQIVIPEEIVCQAVNMAIKANWPDKNLKLGFYQAQVAREQDLSSKNRITENA